MDVINVDTRRTDIGTSTSSDPHPDQGLTSGRLLFDFERFLEGGALDDIFRIPRPDSTPAPIPTPEGGKWEITKLSGGLVNITVRVVPCGRGDGEFGRDPRSVVIKYAPPFVAAMGEGAPFGTFRQVIEYRALSLLGSTPSVTSAEATNKVSIPRVLKFFEGDRVLVLQDLGKRMEPLESWMYPSTTSNTAEFLHSPETCRSVGTRLGNVLASIYCDATLLSKSQTLTEDGKPWFENPDTNDLVRNEIVGRILPILRSYFDTNTDRPEKIAKIISRDFDNSFLHTLRSSSISSPSSNVPNSMFSMGDLWTGSILVGASPAISGSDSGFDSPEVELGLIDWEFAAPARIGQDIAQLSAWLYLFSTSSVWSSTESHYRRAVMDAVATGLGRFGPDFGIRPSNGPGTEGTTEPAMDETLWRRSNAANILITLQEAYAHQVKEYPDYAWLVDEEHDHHGLGKERLAVIRSIWILFGREVIYNAIEAETRFSRFFPMGINGGEKEAEMKWWQRVMIEVGSWHVSMAGDSSDEEFEEVVRRDGVLRRVYTVSG